MSERLLLQVWDVTKSRFVRVLHEGSPVKGLEWVPLDDFLDLLQSQIPENIFAACTGP